jgi:hypothetical protein
MTPNDERSAAEQTLDALDPTAPIRLYVGHSGDEAVATAQMCLDGGVALRDHDARRAPQARLRLRHDADAAPRRAARESRPARSRPRQTASLSTDASASSRSGRIPNTGRPDLLDSRGSGRRARRRPPRPLRASRRQLRLRPSRRRFRLGASRRRSRLRASRRDALNSRGSAASAASLADPRNERPSITTPKGSARPRDSAEQVGRIELDVMLAHDLLVLLLERHDSVMLLLPADVLDHGVHI